MVATKDQERKALEQIRKIVEGLGKNSYIAMAFDGCFEVAEENIANDFGCSMKEKYESAAEDARYFYDKLKATGEENEERIEKLKKEKDKCEVLLSEAYKKLDVKDQIIKTKCAENDTLQNKYHEMKAKVDATEIEIVQLKAKLYDLMTKDI